MNHSSESKSRSGKGVEEDLEGFEDWKWEYKNVLSDIFCQGANQLTNWFEGVRP